MAWNEPGGSGKNPDPWGNRNNGSPPDLDKLLLQLLTKLRALFQKKLANGGGGRHFPVKEYGLGMGVILAAIFVIWGLSGLFIVNPAEQAVVLRLGKYATVVQPGLHWMARFIDSRYLLDVQKIYAFSLQGDFLTKSSEQNESPSVFVAAEAAEKAAKGEQADKSKNIVNVELTVQYRINDPRAYLFGSLDPDNTVQEVASGALSEVIGNMKLDDVLTTGREMLSAGVLERIKEVLSTYRTGLEVITVTLRRVQAPDLVQEAFNDVNRADQDKSIYIQKAQAYASQKVPLAQGMAARTLADATAYQQQVVLAARAEVAKYQALLDVYKVSPYLTRERMYLETMQSVFQHTNKVLVDLPGANNMVYLPLDKLMHSSQSDESDITSRQAAATTLSSPEVKP